MKKSSNPSFHKFADESVRFHYETKYVKNLKSKKLQIEAWDANFMADEYLGTAEVNLYVLATGSEKLSLLIRNHDGTPRGRVKLTLQMTHTAQSPIALSNVSVETKAFKPASPPTPVPSRACPALCPAPHRTATHRVRGLAHAQLSRATR